MKKNIQKKVKVKILHIIKCFLWLNCAWVVKKCVDVEMEWEKSDGKLFNILGTKV